MVSVLKKVCVCVLPTKELVSHNYPIRPSAGRPDSGAHGAWAQYELNGFVGDLPGLHFLAGVLDPLGLGSLD